MSLFNFKGIPISKTQLKNWVENLMEASYIYGFVIGFTSGFWLFLKPTYNVAKDIEEVKQARLRIFQRFVNSLNEKDKEEHEKENA